MNFDIGQWLRDKMPWVTQTHSATGQIEWLTSCPECGRPKLYVNNETGRWFCQYEQRGHQSVVVLVAKVEGIRRKQARQLVYGAGGRAHRRGYRPLPEKPEPEPLPPQFEPLYNDERGWLVPKYLTDRRISAALCHKWGAGVCRTGFWRARLIFPITRVGVYKGFTGRAYGLDHNLEPMQPKWRHGRGFDKTRALFGYDQAYARIAREVCLVEGPFDVLRLEQNGWPAVGMFGKKLTGAQAQMLRRMAVRRVTILPDMNDPNAWRRDVLFANVCKLWDAGITDLRIGVLPVGTDPGAARRSQLRRAIEQAPLCKDVRYRPVRQAILCYKRDASSLGEQVASEKWNDVVPDHR